jgi:hypothetical protein
MHDLIERLEKATGPDRDLDLAIAIAVWGRPGVLVSKQDEPGGPIYDYTYWEYTGSIDAARTLVPDYNGESLDWLVGYDDDCPMATVFTHHGHREWHPGFDPAIALCIAALKARLTAKQ